MEQIIAKPQLSFSEAFNAATSKIFQITGRSRRSEFWWVMAIVFVAGLFLTPLFGFALELLTIPLAIRRLHDTGRSGWWYGVNIILKLGVIVTIIYDVLSFCINIPSFMDMPEPDSYNAGSMISGILSFYAKYFIWGLVIFVYQVVLIVLFCIDSDKEENQYGESPKYQIVESETND